MNNLREALLRCQIECRHLDHKEGEFHRADQPCPVEAGIQALLNDPLVEGPTLQIPIRAAKQIAVEFRKDQVIILAFSKQDGKTWVTTYGRTVEDCRQAAEGGNKLKRVMGWPEELCNAKPSRDQACAHCGHSKAHHKAGDCDFHNKIDGQITFACICSAFRAKL